MFPRSINSSVSASEETLISETDVDAVMAQSDALVAIDDVQKSLNRSRASVYRYTNTDPRNLNPPFNPKKLNPEYRSDQKDPLLFHPNEVASNSCLGMVMPSHFLSILYCMISSHMPKQELRPHLFG